VRQINPRHHNVLEAEIKPGQHHLRFSITARVCSSMVSGNLPAHRAYRATKKRRQPLRCNCALPPDV
jgi:hypothetical protein